MGFHPKTGEESTPFNRQIVDEWRGQSSKVVRRVPSRIDPDKFGFFDQVSGSAKVWYWVSETGDYQFYDGPGFQPNSGDPLNIVSHDSIAAWRQAVQAAVDLKRKEQERQAQEARDRLVKELATKQAELDAKNLADQQAAQEMQKQQQAGVDCDRLAGNPTDIRRKADGPTFDVLRNQTDQAIEACGRRFSNHP